MNELHELTQAFTGAVASEGQMSPPQYFRIAVELLRRAPCRLLLFGAGGDTELFCRANRGGRTVVLEHHDRWIRQIEPLPCTVVRVGYSTELSRGFIEPCPLPEGDLDSVLSESWDVIVVDGPEGYAGHLPGRQQSIFLASRLAGDGAALFLHDAQRPTEALCAARYLKEPDERIGDEPQLAVFSLDRSGGSDFCAGVNTTCF